MSISKKWTHRFGRKKLNCIDLKQENQISVISLCQIIIFFPYMLVNVPRTSFFVTINLCSFYKTLLKNQIPFDTINLTIDDCLKILIKSGCYLFSARIWKELQQIFLVSKQGKAKSAQLQVHICKKSIPTSSSQSDIERTLAYLFTNFPHTFPDAAKNKHFFKSSVKIIRTVLYSWCLVASDTKL